MMKIDFTASVVTGGGVRSRVETMRECYNPSCGEYFDGILSKRGKAFCDSACGFLLLDSMLQKHQINRGELEISVNQNGRPNTNRSDLDFSISHSEGCAMCALAIGEGANIGCDVQRERNYSAEKLERLARTFMSDEELAEFRRSTRQSVDFFTAWMRREAYVKRVGTDIFDCLRCADLKGERFREGVIDVCGGRYYYSICANDFDDDE